MKRAAERRRTGAQKEHDPHGRELLTGCQAILDDIDPYIDNFLLT